MILPQKAYFSREIQIDLENLSTNKPFAVGFIHFDPCPFLSVYFKLRVISNVKSL